MADTRGVFSLSRAFARSKKGTWVTPDGAFAQAPPVSIGYDTGYFGGGLESVDYVTKIDKTTYSTDTTAAVPGANLSEARGASGATGSTTAGYIGGGFFSPPTTRHSRMDKLTYSTETLAYIPGANLSIGRNGVSATGNNSAGYFGGGLTPTIVSTMDKVTFSSDTTAAVPGAALSIASRSVSATGNQSSGYFSGGATPGGARSTTDKLTYSSDTTAAVPGAALSGARYILSATGNSTNGYVAGGFFPGPNFYSTMDKVTYSSDTTAAVPGAALSGARYNMGAAGNQSSGYFAGGAPGPVSTTDKTTYSSDTTAAVPGAALSSALRAPAGVSSRSNALPTQTTYPIVNLLGKPEAPNTGYWTGGEPGPGPYLSSTEKIDLTTDTTSRASSANLLDSTYGNTASSSPAALYSYGGQMPGGAKTTVSKLTYSTETYAYAPGNISQGRLGPKAIGTYEAGYLAGGGSAPTYYSLMSKFTYSTDTSSNLPAAVLTIARASFAAAGSQSAGYWAGGEYPAPNTHTSRIDKCTYSTETTAALPSSLQQSKFGNVGTGGPNAAYFSMGYSPAISSVSNTDKVTYSTDTAAAAPGANATFSGNDGSGGIGNASYGYWGGTFPTITTVNRVNYSTDSTSAIPGANLTTGRNRMGSAGARANGVDYYKPAATPTNSSSDISTAPNTGYFGGGYSGPSIYTRMEKLSYTTDTMTAVPGAALSVQRRTPTATGNLTAGYFSGGYDGANTRTTMDKTTYSSDTTAQVPGASQSSARNNLAATGSSTAGYFSGGQEAGTPYSTTDKLTYSSDTTVAVPGAALSLDRFYLAATGNSTHGYFGSGRNPGISPINVSTMDKLTYSSDTTARIPGASLRSSRYAPGATGNSTAGYFGGGYSIGWYASNGYVSDVDKLSYSTDTTAKVPGAGLSANGFYFGVTGNSGAGYFSGGLSGPVSTMEKLNFSLETSGLVPGGNMSATRYLGGAASARANAVAATTNIV